MRSRIFTAVAIVVLGALALTGCSKGAFAQMVSNYTLTADSNKKFLADNTKRQGVVVLRSGLQYRIIKSGKGTPVRSGMDMVTVVYKGWMINGHVFDQTKPGQPAQFQPSGLIRGWTEALTHMREGDEWEVVVPADLAYGDRGAGGGLIPPGQTLIFDLGVLSVAQAPQ